MKTDRTESVYLALWIFHRLRFTCKARDLDLFMIKPVAILTPEYMSRHKLDIYAMCNDPLLWKDMFHAQLSGVFSRNKQLPFECFKRVIIGRQTVRTDFFLVLK